MGNIKTKDMTNVTFFAADRRQFLVPKNAVNIFAKAYNENVSGLYNPAALCEAAKRFDTCKVELTKAREQIGACINALRTQGWNPRDIRDINGLNASEQRGLRISAAQSGATCNPDTAAQKIGEISEKYNKALENMLEASYIRRAVAIAAYYNTKATISALHKDLSVNDNKYLYWALQSVGASSDRIGAECPPPPPPDSCAGGHRKKERTNNDHNQSLHAVPHQASRRRPHWQ